MFEAAPPNSNAQALLRLIAQQIADLEQMLWAQRQMIAQRGVALPPDVMQRLGALRADLDALRAHALDESTELDELHALTETTHLINSSLDIGYVLDEVMDTAIALTGAERGYIVLRDRFTGELHFRAARDFNRQTIEAERFTVSQTVVAQVARTGEPVVARNALLDPMLRAQDSIVMHAPRSILCVPLIFKGRITGAVYADNRRLPDLFGESELELLMAFAAQAAVAIENARLFDRARRALAEVSEMNALMDNVLASIAGGVLTTDRADRILTYNAAAERILNVPAGAALGQRLGDVLPAVYAELERLIYPVLEQGLQQAVEVEPVLPGRGAVSLSLRLAPLKNSAGETVGMALVVDDLTEIRQRDATLNVVRTYLPPSLVSNIVNIDRAGLEGAEREISIVFADVRGFTTFSEQLPPEELMAVINRYLAISTDAIQLFDGIVDKYMGDAVVGLFNTPLNPQDDHALRAVRAALAMAYDVRALHEVLPPDQRLFYGIGVDTGTAILGTLGSSNRREFTAIGRPVNGAKLLQENAQAGEIILSESTYLQVKDVFTIEPLQPRKVRATGGPQVIYRLTGLRRRS